MSEHQARSLERADIIRRLEAGEELALLDVTDALSVRPRECWKLAGYEGRGRRSDPDLPLSEIPASAWPHLRWQMSEGDMVVDTPAGTRIYDVRVRYPVAADPDQPASATFLFAEAPAQNVQVTVAPLEPNAAFDTMVADDMPVSVPWSLEQYRAALAVSGLSLTADKLRVPGVTITIGGKLERGGAAVLLRNVLLVRRFCLEEKRGKFASDTRAAVSRSLVAWLNAHHPCLVAPNLRIGTKFQHEVARVLRDLGLHSTLRG